MFVISNVTFISANGSSLKLPSYFELFKVSFNKKKSPEYSQAIFFDFFKSILLLKNFSNQVALLSCDFQKVYANRHVFQGDTP